MYNIEDLFKVLQFLRDNPKSEITENYLVQLDVYNDRLLATTNSLTFSGQSLEPSDQITIQSSLNARDKAQKYFDNILHQIAFENIDYTQLKTFMMDWYSSNRTLLDLIHQSTNPFIMPSEDVDLSLQGFGGKLFNESLIRDKNVRALLLTSLTELYKIKGSPQSIITGLSFIGFRNLTLREWWVTRDPKNKNNLLMEGRAVKKGQYFDEYYGQYRLINENEPIPEILHWDSFEKRLQSIGDPHWQYTKDEILTINNDPQTYIRLPSISPYYSIIFNTDMTRINQILSILQRILTLEFNKYLYGLEYAYTMTIDGYSEAVSIIDTWLAFMYAEIRAEEKQKYTDLVNFLKTKDIVAQEYSYPWAYEQLILWCNDENNVPRVILNSFTPSVYTYYGATNELINWWNSIGNNNIPIPEIYYTIFNFPLNPVDLSDDQILHYNGDQYIEGTTQLDIENILDNYNTTLNKTPFIRLPKPTHYTSTVPSQDIGLINQPDVIQNLQEDFMVESYHDIFQYNQIDYDITSHDGSSLEPTTTGIKGQWSIDSKFYYISSDVDTWWRIPVEYEWTDTVFLPTYPYLNDSYFYKGYVYKYVSQNTWCRYVGTFNIDPIGDETFTVGHILYDTPNISIHECMKPDTKYIASFFENSWNSLTNGNATFNFPLLDKELILDLTNRYDSDRLMRGTRALDHVKRLDNLVKELGNKVLVCGYGDTPPIVYEYGRYYSSDDPVSKWKLKINSFQKKVWPGNYTQYEINIDYIIDAEFDIFLVALNLPAGISATFDPPTIIPGGNDHSKIRIDVSNQVFPGTYEFTIRGVGSNEQHTLTLNLIVKGTGENVIYSTIPEPAMWLPTNYSISDINLGMNNQLLNWVDEQADAYELSNQPIPGYRKIASILLDEISTFINTHFRTNDIDFASYFYKFKSSKELLEVIDFFKPKRARLLFYALQVAIDDRLFNTVITDEQIETSKISQSIDTFVPREDQIFIHNENGMFNRQYHIDEPSVSYNEGVFNHWNEHHQRNPELRATVTPDKNRSPKEWPVGYCTFYPRIIFPEGILGVPETTFGGRLEEVDLYDIPGNQYGVIDFEGEGLHSRLNDEYNLIIKGYCSPYYSRDPYTKIGPVTPSVEDSTSVPGIVIERPVFHRPVFIALKEWVSECYPARSPSCCDYYDIGCIHDGEDNPHLTRWDGTRWIAIESDYVHLEEGQRNSGDTYCTPCGVDTFTPDSTLGELPNKYLDSGVFHTTIIARGFTNDYEWVNGVWEKYEIDGTFTSPNEKQFMFGYRRSNLTSSSSSESQPKLVHIFNRDTHLHYWEIFDETNTVRLRTTLKNYLHDQIEKPNFIDKGNGFFKIERSNLLNGNDVDVCNDSWTLLDSQTSTDGNFSNLQLVRHTVETDWVSGLIYPNSNGLKDQIEFDGSYVYQCVGNNNWVRYPIELDWNDETYVYPDSSRNAYGIIYRSNYLYIHIDLYSRYKQWVRISCDESWDSRFTLIAPDETNQTSTTKVNPTMSLPMNTSVFQSGAISFIYKTVSNTTGYDFKYCGDVVPFLETYRGMWELYKLPGEIWCEKYKVWDELLIIDDQLKFKEAVRIIPNWKNNTWQAFEPDYEQEATWSEMVTTGEAWVDLEKIKQNSPPFMSEDEWNGIRSNDLPTYQYYYNILNTKYPMFNWPPFEPDLSKFSDKDYWNVYDEIGYGLVHNFGTAETIRSLDLDRYRLIEESGSNQLFENNNIQINESRETIKDIITIIVSDHGVIIPETEWYIAPTYPMLWEDGKEQLFEDGDNQYIEQGNL